MEELFFRATDEPCTEDWCAENLAETRELRDAGKFVLAVDYATRADDVRRPVAGIAPKASPARDRAGARPAHRTLRLSSRDHHDSP